MGDVLLFCFSECHVYYGGKAFSEILLKLAVGHSVELFVFNLLHVAIPD